MILEKILRFSQDYPCYSISGDGRGSAPNPAGGNDFPQTPSLKMQWRLFWFLPVPAMHSCQSVSDTVNQFVQLSIKSFGKMGGWGKENLVHKVSFPQKRSQAHAASMSMLSR